MATGAVVARILSEYSDKGTKAAQKDLKAAGKSFDDFGKKVKESFEIAAAASVAFAVKVGFDSVKLAMADQQSAAILANTLKNTTNANEALIASTEEYVKATELRLGVVDTELRPSLNALVTATHSVTEAEKLQQLALNISAGRGKDLSAVSIALAKAYDGNFSALKRLGIPLSETLVKSKDFTGIVNELSAAVKGDATVAADSLAGQMTRMQLGFDEAKKSLGYALMPAVQSFIDQLNTQIIPKVQAWIDLNKDKLVAGLKTAADGVVTLVKKAISFAEWISTHMTLIKDFAVVLGTLWATSKVLAFISVINKVATAFKAMAAAETLAVIAETFLTGGLNLAAGTLALGVAGAALATYGLVSNLNAATDATVQLSAAQKDLNNPLSGKAFGSSSWIKDQADATAKLKAQQDANAKAALDAAKQLAAIQTASQLKAAKANADAILAQQTLNKLTATNGITTANTTDPVELEAARLNLMKQGNVEAQNQFDQLIQNIQAQTALNAASSKYSDILGVLADQTISSSEVETLAKKWGMSDSAVVAYIAQVTGAAAFDPKDLGTPGAVAADGWMKALIALNAYDSKLRDTPLKPFIAPTPSGGGTSDPVVQGAINTIVAQGKGQDGGILNSNGSDKAGGGNGAPVVNVTVLGSVVSQYDLAQGITDQLLRTVSNGSNFLQFSATGGL